MDFGKKGDAKRAMKLMWKEGITLKQAWKRVKSGHSGKKGKKSKKGDMSPKKKRAVAKAKKAMKLHHREGITLKQAWKRVNKFGDTVCPPGYEPNVMWTGGSGQRQCVKMCPDGFYRDPESNRCKKIRTARTAMVVPPGMEINPETGRLRKMCVPPQVRNPVTKRCKNPVSDVVPPGMERNPETGRLRKICDVGYYRDPVTGRCRKIKTVLQPLIAPPYEPPVVPPFGGATLMDFGGRYREAKHCGSFGRKTSGFGKVRMCGFGTCKTCAMR